MHTLIYNLQNNFKTPSRQKTHQILHHFFVKDKYIPKDLMSNDLAQGWANAARQLILCVPRGHLKYVLLKKHKTEENVMFLMINRKVRI